VRAEFAIGVFVMLAMGTTSGCTDAAPPESICHAESLPAYDLVIAGSGSNLPLVEALVAQWPNRDGARILIPESIGSTGAVEALADGVIDIGLVSRPLTPEEHGEGFTVVPLARTPLAVVRHAPGGTTSLTSDDLLAIFLGELRAWPDGTPVVPVLREAGDSGAAIIAVADPRLGRVMHDASRADRWQVALTDQAMRTVLAETPGAIGFLDLGIVGTDPGLAVVTLDGRHPSDAETWPFIKTLSLVVPDETSPLARALVGWLASPARHSDIHAIGWLAPH
jgi:phosphate transport system substrate-binding protein